MIKWLIFEAIKRVNWTKKKTQFLSIGANNLCRLGNNRLGLNATMSLFFCLSALSSAVSRYSTRFDINSFCWIQSIILWAELNECKRITLCRIVWNTCWGDSVLKDFSVAHHQEKWNFLDSGACHRIFMWTYFKMIVEMKRWINNSPTHWFQIDKMQFVVLDFLLYCSATETVCRHLWPTSVDSR